MMLHPPDRVTLAASLRAANESREVVEGADLSAMNRILRHTPEDMTAKVEAGLTLGELQRALAGCRQWLPIDPPSPDTLTIGALIASNVSGPRRYGFGTIRDHLIGLEVALADGRLVKSGGNVVKNVAGYDLMKLFVGGRDSLGVVVEASFKLLPLPEQERFVGMTCQSLEAAGRTVESVIESELTPIVLDLHRLQAGSPSAMPTLVVGFAGTGEEVEWQVDRVASLGVSESATLDYHTRFWSAAEIAPKRMSVLPSRLTETLRSLGNEPFVAHAGSGVIFHRGNFVQQKAELPLKLMRRVKEAFDPNRILPDIPM